jgi:hypothetical protein
LNKCYYYSKSSQQKKNNIKTLKEIMVFKIVFIMSNTSIKYLIQAIIIIISFTIPLTLDSSSLLTTTTTALAFHVDSAGNPTIRQGDVDTARGTTAAAGGSGGNTAVATVALNYINETRKAIQIGNSTAALTNLDLVERQLSLLITPSSNTSSSSSPLLSSPSTLSTPSIQTPSAVIVEGELSHENCNDNADNDHDGQIDEGCGGTVRR